MVSSPSPSPSPSPPNPKPKPPHVVIFPFMAQGHTLPLLDLSKSLSSNRNLQITIITTPSNAPSIQNYISTRHYPNIHLKAIPFPVHQGLPNGCENTSSLPSMAYLIPFLTVTIQLQKPFEQILQHMAESKSLPICVISDFFLDWTLATCRKFNVPRLVFHGMGVVSMVISKYLWEHAEHLITHSSDPNEPLQLTGLKVSLPFTLTKSELPESLRVIDRSDPFSRFVVGCVESESESWGVVVNSFEELEKEHVATLESFWPNGAKAWCVGPLLHRDHKMDGEDEKKTSDIDVWLDRQSTRSVMYVAFGTQADVSDIQLDEVVLGLEMAGHPFICVIRSKTWVPPEGLELRVKGWGLIIRDWVDQRSILANRATGGFLSHCGWNSVMESLSMGVPLLVWPMMAEQPLNAKFVVEGIEAGLWLPRVPIESKKVGVEEKETVVALVRREGICEGVKELMGITSEKGRKVREKAEGIGRVAREAVQEGGSSYKCLNELIDSLICSEKTSKTDTTKANLYLPSGGDADLKAKVSLLQLNDSDQNLMLLLRK